VIDRTLTVTQDGKPRELTMEEALQHSTYQAAIKGNRSARREVLKMIAKREQYLVSRQDTQAARYEFRTEIDPENADAALLILGIAACDLSTQAPGHEGDLRLEPWAAQAALIRRRGGERLTDMERAEIRRCTRDADTLRWPRDRGK
jgi:hypothetical protein